MNAKLVSFLFIVIALAMLGGALTVQADVEEDPKQNWCFPGGPWGNGRCNDEDPFVREWYWTCGYWRAAVLHNGFPANDVPEMCRVDLRLIAIEFRLSDVITRPVTPPDNDETPGEDETPVEEPPPLATFNMGVSWCQYAVEPSSRPNGYTQVNFVWSGVPVGTNRLVFPWDGYRTEIWGDFGNPASGGNGDLLWHFNYRNIPTLASTTVLAYQNDTLVGTAAFSERNCTMWAG